MAWNDILSNTAGAVGAGAGVASSVFDFINSGKDTGVYSAGLVRDVNTDGFLASNPLHKPEYFIRAFDEPTYLTFKLEFMFHQNRNALFSNDALTHMGNSLIYSEDGDTEHGYDYLPEAFLEDGMLTQNDNFATNKDATGSSPSYSPMAYTRNSKGLLELSKADDFVSYYYSAEDYLGLNRGEYGRARLIRKIKMILKDITENFPYYFKSIEGLDKLNLINPKAGYRLADDVVLTIKCYEGLDLKITQLIQMIRKVTWDDMYQRWVLPDIMRYFGMRIYVSEIRTFHEMAKKDLFGLRQKQKLTTFDYRADKNGELRNATEMSAAKTWFAKIMNFTSGILTAASALGNTYFGGTGFANAINTVGSTVATVSDITGSLNQIYQVMCVSAINDVMPTICYECHMCEFDVLDNMSEMSSLSSTSGDPQEQVIRIKVRQVQDFQVYPLDRNLTINGEGNGYAILNRMYGTYEDAGDDDKTYEQLRAEGFTGSTVFADTVFDEKFNGVMRQMYDKAAGGGNGVTQTKLYRNLASLYDDALKNFFVNNGFNRIGGENNEPFSPRSKMYPGKESLEKIHNDKGALAYKRNSLDVTENIMKLLVGGLNAANQIAGAMGGSMNAYDNGFSRATGVTYNLSPEGQTSYDPTFDYKGKIKKNLSGMMPDIEELSSKYTWDSSGFDSSFSKSTGVSYKISPNNNTTADQASYDPSFGYNEQISKTLSGMNPDIVNLNENYKWDSSIFDNVFSKGTGVTYDDFAQKLPEMYVATQALHSTMERMIDENLNDTALGAFEFLNHVAYSKATKYTPIGVVASTVLENVDNPWREINTYERYAMDENGNPLPSTVHVRRNWSTIAQDPFHNRQNIPGNVPAEPYAEPQR